MPAYVNRIAALLALMLFGLASACAQDLDAIKARGVLRHLGIPYANFVTGSGDGLDVEIMQRFAQYLGVKYQYVKTDWKQALGDLTGKRLVQKEGRLRDLGPAPVRGDLIANGLTVLPVREQWIDYSIPTFPTGVWLVARADSAMAPIRPSGQLDRDIDVTKSRLPKVSTLVMEATCLDPNLYKLTGKGLDLRYYTRSTNLNEMVPAILNRDAETTLLDVPDALIALEKWPGQIKVIGPISDRQVMGVGFRKDAPKLRAAFNAFFRQMLQDGSYLALVNKYYPSAVRYFPDFFKSAEGGR
jgi:ABC-type amino acid transport substrate-binding protein